MCAVQLFFTCGLIISTGATADAQGIELGLGEAQTRVLCP
jgi:hypothetical protein